ncbi:MAG: hypothetical protein CVU08_02430 [Bacteroidetes bacterium HGW-Bacteroidetes-3]|nr:MAG: hypothetical protein CVU08_02430 [Bacteroidetes bacterium HGW-Bacteroidetes-3]
MVKIQKIIYEFIHNSLFTNCFIVFFIFYFFLNSTIDSATYKDNKYSLINLVKTLFLWCFMYRKFKPNSLKTCLVCYLQPKILV